MLAGAGDKEFVFAKRFDLGLANGDDGEGVAHGVEDLQFVARFLTGAAFVVFHDGRNIAATKVLLREILGECDAGEKRIIHDRSSRRRLASADAEHFVFLKRLDGRFGNAGDRDGVAESVENLDRVSILASGHGVVVDDLDDIACTKIVLSNVASQNGISVELESHLRMVLESSLGFSGSRSPLGSIDDKRQPEAPVLGGDLTGSAEHRSIRLLQKLIF